MVVGQQGEKGGRGLVAEGVWVKSDHSFLSHC